VGVVVNSAKRLWSTAYAVRCAAIQSVGVVVHSAKEL